MNSKWLRLANIFTRHQYHYNKTLPTTIQRFATSESQDKLEKKDPRITVTDDGQTIVCWHPPEPFPYEHTLPYTEEIAVPNESSVLNIETMEKGENIFYKVPITLLGMEELQAITYTNKYHWKRRRYDGLQMTPDPPRKGV